MDKKLIRTHRDMDMYKIAFELAMQIHKKVRLSLKKNVTHLLIKYDVLRDQSVPTW